MPKFHIVVETTYTVDAENPEDAYSKWAFSEAKLDEEYTNPTVYDSNGDRCKIEAQ